MSSNADKVNLATAEEFHGEIARLQAEIERLRLTDAEREAVEAAIGWIESPSAEDEAMPDDYLPITATLRGLLERTVAASDMTGERVPKTVQRRHGRLDGMDATLTDEERAVAPPFWDCPDCGRELDWHEETVTWCDECGAEWRYGEDG